MRKTTAKSGSIATFLALSLCGTNAAADTQAQYDAVEALGTLNGIALQCKHLDEMRRMKEAMVANAPKERSFGLAFDQATNDSFLAFLDAKSPCPSTAGFAADVDDAIATLQRAFGQQ